MRAVIQIGTILGFLAVSACGDTVGEQAVIGAGAGTVTAAAVNGNLLGGAIIGAGANVLYCDQNPGKC